jgi:hypothetical protein
MKSSRSIFRVLAPNIVLAINQEPSIASRNQDSLWLEMSSRATLSIFSVTLASDRLSGIVMSVALTKFTRVAFVLVEILIAVAAIALLVAMTAPAFLRTRKSSQVTQIPNGLRRVDSAVGQYAA